MKTTFDTFDSLVIRTPLWPYKYADELSEQGLLSALDDKLFKEAVWLASPVLYDEAMKWKNGELSVKESKKVQYSLAKYYQRLCTRATPFGMFAGCSAIKISDTEHVGFSGIKRATRLDANFLFKLIVTLENMPAMRRKFSYSANSSLYPLMDKYRYHEFSYDDRFKKYNVVDVERNEYLDEIVALCTKQEVLYKDLVSYLAKDDISTEEAEEYINDLISSQVLVSCIEPTTLSDDLLNDLIKELDKIQDTEITGLITMLVQIQDALNELDKNEINEITDYDKVISLIQKLGVEFDRSKLFQVDVYRVPDENSSFNRKELEAMYEAANVVNALSKPGVTNLKTFIQKFTERYENEEVQMTMLLDSDTGLGYPANNANKADTPLIDDFVVFKQGMSNEVKLESSEAYMLQLLIESVSTKEYTLDITKFVSEKNIPPLQSTVQPTVNMIFNKVMLDGKEHLIYNFIGGNSAIDFFGRFAHTDPQMGKLVKELSDHEQKCAPEYIYADIVHFPEAARIANISLKPSIYPYQVPYLAKPSNDKEAININDIMVSVFNGKVYLRSKTLNKYIIPRLSNAHNYSSSKIPIYFFLCDVQNQSQTKFISFNWGPGGQYFKFHPRVVYKNVILEEASWTMDGNDVGRILQAIKQNSSAEDVKSLIAEWRKKNQIPVKVVVTSGDNELYVNFDNELSTLTFFDEIKKSRQITIKEFLYGDSSVTSGYVNHIVAPLGSKATMALPQRGNPPENAMMRKFLPGSEVVYLKLYGGHKFLERILIENLYPFISELIAAKKIDKWFFIRFSDPEYHLRIRLFVPDKSTAAEILHEFNALLSGFINDNILWKLNTDTYARELERYGYKYMDVAEHLFFYDSECTMEMLRIMRDNGNDEAFRWQSAVLNVDYLLNDAQYTVEEKYDIMKPLRNGYFNEFGASKTLLDVLNKKYRTHKQMIERTLSHNFEQEFFSAELVPSLLRRSDNIKGLLNFIKEDNSNALKQLAGSYIHMTLNRHFLSEPNKHELVIYDFLDRHYKSEIARKSKKNVNVVA